VSQLAAPGPLTTSFTPRDDRGRPTTVTLPGGRTLGLGYDPPHGTQRAPFSSDAQREKPIALQR
jgi:hypothetical protein